MEDARGIFPAITSAPSIITVVSSVSNKKPLKIFLQGLLFKIDLSDEELFYLLSSGLPLSKSTLAFRKAMFV
jgi:hypothetical protein